jgi:hypothetical protein
MKYSYFQECGPPRYPLGAVTASHVNISTGILILIPADASRSTSFVPGSEVAAGSEGAVTAGLVSYSL